MHPRIFTAVAVLLALLFAFSVGCGDDNNKPDTPSVKSVQPANSATCVDMGSKVQVTFSGAVDSNTVNTANIQVTDAANNPVPATVTYDAATNTATFTPTSPLVSSATYTVNVNGVSNSSGTRMSSPFTSTFTTGPCSGAQNQYQVSLVASKSLKGQVLVDTSGVVTAKVDGAAASTTYQLQFCPAPAQNYPCFAIGDVTTDATGNANITMPFPKSGSWAGDFQALQNGVVQFDTELAPSIDSSVYSATLQPSKTANGNGVFLTGPPPATQDPLSSGTVTLTSGGVMQFDLKGAFSNSMYGTTECPINFGSSCFQLTNSNGVSGFTTDSSGNVSFGVLWDQDFGDIFRVDAPAGRAGFVAGFKVP